MTVSTARSNATCDCIQMTVSLRGVFIIYMLKTGNASVIPFIGDQTVRILGKLLLTVNGKLRNRKLPVVKWQSAESV